MHPGVPQYAPYPAAPFPSQFPLPAFAPPQQPQVSSGMYVPPLPALTMAMPPPSGWPVASPPQAVWHTQPYPAPSPHDGGAYSALASLPIGPPHLLQHPALGGVAPHGYAYGNGVPFPNYYCPPAPAVPQPVAFTTVCYNVPAAYGALPHMPHQQPLLNPAPPLPMMLPQMMPPLTMSPPAASMPDPQLSMMMPPTTSPAYVTDASATGFGPLKPLPTTPGSADSNYGVPSGVSSGDGNQSEGKRRGGDSTAVLASQVRTEAGSLSDSATTRKFLGGQHNSFGGSSESGQSAPDARPHYGHRQDRHLSGGHSSTESGSTCGNTDNAVVRNDVLASTGADAATFGESHPRHPPTGSTRRGADFNRQESNRAICEQRQLIVKFLTDETSDDQLRALFEQFGPVENARQVMDKKTGHTKGFGFVTYVNACDAVKALHTMRGYQLGSRQLNVALAQTERNRDF